MLHTEIKFGCRRENLHANDKENLRLCLRFSVCYAEHMLKSLLKILFHTINTENKLEN